MRIATAVAGYNRPPRTLNREEHHCFPGTPVLLSKVSRAHPCDDLFRRHGAQWR
jgi:hypothetical protein